MVSSNRGYGAFALVFLVLGLMSVISWFVHVYTCIQEEAWGFLVAGAIMFPIAIVHGLGVMLGIF